ncbi:t-SNARE domain-containing protein 1-like [Amphiura filiformis]|uniref:t-SNARE domain-containing protein 1-like n=1 Tax=Amphiura filiformis TaxID=82378 RepID=UPI003B216CAA
MDGNGRQKKPNKPSGEATKASDKDSENKKIRKRAPNWKEIEITTLASFVQEHKALLFGSKKGSGRVETVKREYWERAAKAIRVAGGEARDWLNVRHKWRDLSTQANNLNTEIRLTGGGPVPESKPYLMDVLQAQAREVRDGLRPQSAETFAQSAVVNVVSDSSQESMSQEREFK